MMPLIWTKQLSVGNATLDSEHKNLIGIIDNIEYVINARDSFALLHSINRFKKCAHVHFMNEEQFAQAIKFPFAEHNLSHHYFYKELQHTIDELEIRFGGWVEYLWDYYAQFLREWLIEHIAGKDMLMKPFLQACPYDFKPSGLHAEYPDIQSDGYEGESRWQENNSVFSPRGRWLGYRVGQPIDYKSVRPELVEGLYGSTGSPRTGNFLMADSIVVVGHCFDLACKTQPG